MPINLTILTFRYGRLNVFNLLRNLLRDQHTMTPDSMIPTVMFGQVIPWTEQCKTCEDLGVTDHMYCSQSQTK